MPVKPIIPALTLEILTRVDLAGALIQEKSDGCHEFLPWGGHVFNAERMRDGSRVINDAVALFGQDCTNLATSARWRELCALAGGFEAGMRLSRAGYGRDFITSETGRNGSCDIVVIKPLDAGFGSGWLKVKFAIPYPCRVVALDHARGSVALVDSLTGDARGKLPLRGGKFERVGIGSVLKVVAAGIHPKTGLLREARLDTDTPESWLVSR